MAFGDPSSVPALTQDELFRRGNGHGEHPASAPHRPGSDSSPWTPPFRILSRSADIGIRKAQDMLTLTYHVQFVISCFWFFVGFLRENVFCWSGFAGSLRVPQITTVPVGTAQNVVCRGKSE